MSTRRERVVLELQDDFTPDMLRAAAAAALLKKELNGLDESGRRSSAGVDRSTRSNENFTRSTQKSARAAEDVGRTMDRSSASIDKYSGRLGLLANVAGLLGPATIPIAAITIPAVAGLAAQFGFAAIAAGTAVAAFQGVGTALTALNKAQLEPTAANLQAAQVAMEAISPAAQDFARHLQTVIPQLKAMRDTAAEGMFPGLTQGIDSMEAALPHVQKLIAAVSGELGNIGANAGAGLASPRWTGFIDFLAAEAPKALADMAQAAGNTAHAMAGLWMAFTPSNNAFSTWMVNATRSLDTWSTGLSKTAGFQEFMDYLRTTGPQVGATLGAIGSALLQMVEAAAPIGGPILQGLEGFAKAISAIADSDLGTPIFGAVAALSALNLAMRTTGALSKASFGSPVVASMKKQSAGIRTLAADYKAFQAVQRARSGSAGMVGGPAFANGEQIRNAERFKGTLVRTGAAAGKTGALIAGMAIASSGAADKFGLTNTASLALMGTFVGGGLGAAIGATAGAAIDLAHANDGLYDSLDKLSAMAGKVDFGTFNRQLADAKSKIDDLGHSTGFKDFFTDTLKSASATLHGRGLTKGQITKSFQGDANAAEANQMAAGREKGAAAAATALARANDLAAHGFQLTAAGAAEASSSVTQFTASVNAANAALGRDSKIDAYKTSLLDAAQALKDNGNVLRGNTRAAIDNRTKLRGIASGALDAAEGMKNFGRRTAFLDKARTRFIGMAKAMGASAPEARKMANAYGLVDRVTAKSAESVKGLSAQIKGLKSKIVQAKANGAKESSPQVQKLRAEIERLKGKKVQVTEQGAAAAAARARALRDAINALHNKSIVISVAQHGAIRNPKNAADGATVPKTGLPYADRHLYLLADGEEIVSNRHGQADRFRADRAAGIIPGYADGGTTGDRRRRKGGKGKGNGDQLSPTRRHLKALDDALGRSTKAIDKEKTARDDLISRRNDLSSTAAGGFLNDQFAAPANVWAGGAGGVLGNLKTDTANANAYKALLATLQKSGLKGQALASVDTLDKAKAVSALGASGTQQYQTLFNQRAAAAGSAGAYLGNSVYAAQIQSQTKHLATMNVQVKHLNTEIAHLRKDLSHHPKQTGAEVGKHINKAAAAGQRAKRR